MKPRHLALAAALVLGTATPSWGACITSDLAGLYQVYNWSAPFGEMVWSRCVFRVFNKGNIKPGGECRGSGGGVSTVVGGKFFINKACVVTGTLVTEFQGIPEVNIIDHATFDLGRATMIGGGHSEIGPNFAFTALRR